MGLINILMLENWQIHINKRLFIIIFGNYPPLNLIWSWGSFTRLENILRAIYSNIIYIWISFQFSSIHRILYQIYFRLVYIDISYHIKDDLLSASIYLSRLLDWKKSWQNRECVVLNSFSIYMNFWQCLASVHIHWELRVCATHELYGHYYILGDWCPRILKHARELLNRGGLRDCHESRLFEFSFLFIWWINL